MPATGDFGYHEVDFSDAIRSLEKNHGDLLTQIGNLERELNGILGRWVGPAKMAYEAAQAEWSQSAMNTTEALNAARRCTGATLTTYMDTEDQSMRMWG